jgi:hypothetical protein
VSTSPFGNAGGPQRPEESPVDFAIMRFQAAMFKASNVLLHVRARPEFQYLSPDNIDLLDGMFQLAAVKIDECRITLQLLRQELERVDNLQPVSKLHELLDELVAEERKSEGH